MSEAVKAIEDVLSQLRSIVLCDCVAEGDSDAAKRSRKAVEIAGGSLSTAIRFMTAARAAAVNAERAAQGDEGS